MEFTSNHDENSWNGTEFERLGNGAQTFSVLAATVPGMLLIYNGQEAAFNRRLKFFEKDTIDWKNNSFSDFYKKLIEIKKQNKALWNGLEGGTFERIKTTDNKHIFAFKRERDGNNVVVILNLTGKTKSFAIRSDKANGDYNEIFSGSKIDLMNNKKIVLKEWQYLVMIKD
jgi:hypothetical protein